MYAYQFTANDRFQFNRKDEHRIERLASKLDYPIEDILRAVQEVGFDADEVEEYIRDRYNRL
jgi:hypothetical protein